MSQTRSLPPYPVLYDTSSTKSRMSSIQSCAFPEGLTKPGFSASILSYASYAMIFLLATIRLRASPKRSTEGSGSSYVTVVSNVCVRP